MERSAVISGWFEKRCKEGSLVAFWSRRHVEINGAATGSHNAMLTYRKSFYDEKEATKVPLRNAVVAVRKDNLQIRFRGGRSSPPPHCWIDQSLLGQVNLVQSSLGIRRPERTPIARSMAACHCTGGQIV